jgi:hypothetical protein
VPRKNNAEHMDADTTATSRWKIDTERCRLAEPDEPERDDAENASGTMDCATGK